MALIDVTSILIDPDFVNKVVIVHRTPIVDSKGQNVLSETLVNTLGVVEPASGKTLERLPNELRIKSTYSFWIKGQIISDGTSEYPDLIKFNGVTYAVQTILDYMNWPGTNGWTEGVAIRQVPTL